MDGKKRYVNMDMTLLRHCALSLVILLVMSATVNGEDSRGMFSVKGVGTANCAHYLDARREKGKEFLLYAGYLGGYVTAYNKLSSETFDILPWQNIDTLLGLLANYCTQQPDHNYAVAVSELIQMLTPSRLEVASKITEARTPQGSVRIYHETLRRIQAKLAVLGHYNGSADGLFGPNTRRGIEIYQEIKGLKKTGLPDQPTLFTLFFTEQAEK
jgi:hypothetical protein